jgi:exodeoxyribonuclease V alpha subunit
MNQPPSKQTTAETLQGSIERVTFHSPESGFCVLKVKVKGHKDLVTVTGSAATINPGEYIECTGNWFNDKNYGMQFKSTRLVPIQPTTLDGIEKYLGSGMVKGIGPHFARTLIKAFGDKVFDIIENDPSRLRSLPGIGSKRSEMVVQGWAEQKAVREIMVFLQSYGVGTSRAVRIYKTYGNEAVSKVSENPYRLALDIHGVGFKTADTIALKMGIPKDSILRARAGVRHALQELSAEGHCAADREKLTEKIAEILEIAESLAGEAIEREIISANVISETAPDGRELVFLVSLHRAETGCAENLQRLMNHGSEGSPPSLPWGTIDFDTAIPHVEQINNIELSTTQKQALQLALSNKAVVVTGGPGVGKTTLINSIIKIILQNKNRDQQALQLVLCAPTGRAAKRLGESTSMEAKTIHRLLEFEPKSMGFKRNRENPLQADVVVIDEASMIDVNLMHHLLKAVPDKAALIVVGDVDQLPSVGPGAVLADLIASQALPTVRLTEIFRQAASSRIIVNAHRINAGEMPIIDIPNQKNDPDLTDFYFIKGNNPQDITKKLLQVVSQRIPQRFGLDAVRDVQVLTPMNRGPLGSRSLNVELQKELNKNAGIKVERFGTSYGVGDKVLQIINNYDKEVFNGDIGTIQKVAPEESELYIDFDGRLIQYDFNELDELNLAYAASIHKSQGSEYPAVVIPLAMQHYMMLERNLLYTGVTRGKKLVVIIGQDKALEMACQNKKANLRTTTLSQRLKDLLA